MMFLNTFALASAALLGSAIAQSATESSDAAAATHTFAVGADGRTFTPHSRTVPVGDILEFRFYPQNHSVVKAEFGPEPCIPYEMTGAGKTGWWSGWMPTAVVDTTRQPVFRIRVNDTEPLSVYCSSPNACKEGMVAVINGNATHNYESQLANTQKANAFLSPGEYFPEEKFDPQESSTPNSTTNGTEDKDHGHTLGTGAIVGIAIGGVVVLALAGLVLFMCGRQKSFKDIMKASSSKSTGSEDTTTAYHPASPGFSEANYSNNNMLKSPAMTDSRFSTNTYGAETYRSVSPQLDERGHSMFGVMAGGQHSPGIGSPSWPSPSYQEVHEADSSASVKGSPAPYQVHEMAAPLPSNLSPNTPEKTFAYTKP